MKDYSIKASELKSLIRSWRTRGVKPIDAMRVMLLYLGAERYMDAQSGAYLSTSFNRMRKEYKYRDTATLLQVVITSGSFRVVRRKEDHLVVAFYSPQVVSSFPLGDDLYESSGPPAVTGSDSSLFKTHTKDVSLKRPSLGDGLDAEAAATELVARWEARSSRRDRKHFRKVPAPMARDRLEYFFYGFCQQHYDQWQRIFQPLHSALLAKGLDQAEATSAVDLYTRQRIIPHMECRKGIENWYDPQIAGWAASFMQQRYLSLRIHECLQLWQLIHPSQSVNS